MTAAAEAHTDESTLDFSTAALVPLLEEQRTGTAAILRCGWALKAAGLARVEGPAMLCILALKLKLSSPTGQSTCSLLRNEEVKFARR